MTLIGHDDILHPTISRDGPIDRKASHATLCTRLILIFIDAAGKHISYCKPMDEVQYGHEFLPAT